jgi:hypothetical protein
MGGFFVSSFFYKYLKRSSKMKTFGQFYAEASRLDKELKKTEQEFRTGNLMQKIRTTERMKKLEAGSGVSSLVKPAD